MTPSGKSGVIADMSRITRFLSDFQRTKLGILIDDLSCSRAVLVAPIESISEAEVNRILSLSGGLTFVALSAERASAFMLQTMARPSITGRGSLNPTFETAETAQYVSVEAREGITTGISAADRAKTLQILGAQNIQPRALVKPGHIFPVETREGGVLVKTALPEGALDIVRMAGHSDAALFVDLLSADGALENSDGAARCAEREELPSLTLSELIRHRLEHESLVEKVAESTLPTTLAGEVRALVYHSKMTNVEHVALVKGTVAGDAPVLVRVQAEHTVSDVFGGTTPASRANLQNSLKEIGERGCGVVLYLRRPFTDHKGSTVQHVSETPPSKAATMMRDYGVGAQILRDLGITNVELLTSTPRALEGLSSFGITVVRQLPIPQLLPPTGHTV